MLTELGNLAIHDSQKTLYIDSKCGVNNASGALPLQAYNLFLIVFLCVLRVLRGVRFFGGELWR